MMRRAMFAFLDLPVCASGWTSPTAICAISIPRRSSAGYPRLGYAPGAPAGPLPRVRHPLRAIAERVEGILTGASVVALGEVLHPAMPAISLAASASSCSRTSAVA